MSKPGGMRQIDPSELDGTFGDEGDPALDKYKEGQPGAPSSMVINALDLSTEDLSNLRSFQDALATAAKSGELIAGADHIGDGFKVVDKSELVGRKCVFLTASFYAGEYGNEVVALKGVRDDSLKFVINDGSTGIYEQVKELVRKFDGRFPPFTSEDGLRASKYEKEIDGKVIPATTYYLAG